MSKILYTLVGLICVYYVRGEPCRRMEIDLCGKIITEAMTPYTDNGELNLSMISNIAKYYAANNLTNIHIMEYGGGGATLRLKERIALVTEWLKYRYMGFKFIVEVGLQPFVDTLTLASFCSKQNVSAITHFPEQIYKANTIEEAIEELRRISEVAPNIPLIYNELISNAPIISTEAVYFSGDEVCTFCGVETSPNTNNNIDAGTPICTNNKTSQCKKEVWIFDIQNINTAFFLGLRSVTLAPNLFPRIAIGMEAAADNCDKVTAKILRNKMNSLVSAVVLNKGPINTYYRPYFQRMKAGFQLITGYNVGARFPFVKANSTEYDQIARNLRSLGVRLAETSNQ